MAKSTLSAKISNCTISLGLDKRHSKSNLYPVCIRYSFNGKFMYYPIGDQDRPLCFDYALVSEKYGISLETFTGEQEEDKPETQQQDLPF